MLHIKVNGIQRIAGLRNGTDTSEVNFYRWNPDLYQFVIDSSKYSLFDALKIEISIRFVFDFQACLK